MSDNPSGIIKPIWSDIPTKETGELWQNVPTTDQELLDARNARNKKEPDFKRGSFLGASIRYFNTSLGWGDQSSILTVGLVEDPKAQETFEYPYCGSFHKFEYNKWNYYGILSSVSEQRSEAGNRVFDVTLTDPRTLADGIQLVLNGFTGATNQVPNLYNIYGYLENQGYGNALVNESGMPWYLIKDSIQTLVSQSPIQFLGTSFLLDISNLPSPSLDFRIQGNTISLLSFIQEVCDITNYDFFMYFMGNLIKIGVKSKNIIYLPGSIKRFIDQSKLYKVRTESGFELANNPTNKFLIGAQVEQLYLQYNSTGLTVGDNKLSVGIIADVKTDEVEEGDGEMPEDDNPFDDTITRYWGVDEFGNAIIQKWVRAFHESNSNLKDYWVQAFRIDGRPISFPGRDFRSGYWVTVPEIKAALESQEAWETFISSMSDYAEICKDGGPDENHIYYKRKEKILGPSGALSGELRGNLFFIMRNNPDQALSLSPSDVYNYKLKASDENVATITKIYSYIRDLGSRYYGKKFMVKVPFVLAKIDEESEIQTSLEPTESGYIEESEQERAVYNGVLPDFIDFVRNEEGKITSYVRFDGGDFPHYIDLSQIPEDSFYVSGNYIYVKCSVDPKLVFLDRSTAFSPRAVIELAGPVFDARDIKAEYLNICIAALAKNIDPEDLINDEEELKKVLKVGNDFILKSPVPTTFYPNLAVIPLKDNTMVYGPWYSSSSIKGKVEFEQNHDINPWSFGGFRNMNSAALAIVNEVYANSLESESGTLEIPGAPAVQLGADLIDKGPTVTDINVTVDPDNGVTTTYRMSRWNLKPGRENKHRLEMFKKVYKLQNEQKRLFRDLFKPKNPNATSNVFLPGKSFYTKRPRRVNPNSSNHIIISESVPRGGNPFRHNIVTIPSYQITNYLTDDDKWRTKAGVTFDGIFKPFSTYSGDSIYMPTFEEPEGSFADYNNLGSGNTGTSANSKRDLLNPYFSNNFYYDAIGAFFHGSGFPEKGINNGTLVKGEGGNVDFERKENIRSIGLKLPMIGVGRGVNTNDYERAGPIDFRWDSEDKVWESHAKVFAIASIGNNEIQSRHNQGYSFGWGGARIHKIVNGDLVPIMTSSGTYLDVTVYNWFSDPIPPNSWVYIAKEGYSDCWCIVSVDCNNSYPPASYPGA